MAQVGHARALYGFLGAVHKIMAARAVGVHVDKAGSEVAAAKVDDLGRRGIAPGHVRDNAVLDDHAVTVKDPVSEDNSAVRENSFHSSPLKIVQMPPAES